MGDYDQNYLKQIKNAQTDDDIASIINRVYQDGFKDGHDEGIKDAKSGDF